MTSPLWLAVGLQYISEGIFTRFKMCVLFITRISWLMGRLGARKQVSQ